MLEEIEGHARLQTGFLFRRHIYSAQQLLDCEEMKKVEAVLNTLSINYTAAAMVGNVSNIDRMSYEYFLEKVNLKIEKIKAIVRMRRPTTWERIAYPINTAFSFLLKRLPRAVQGYLSPWIETIKLIEGI
ncbi:MAG: hypothetical protein AAGF98_07220 [Cyanobacteria bacterium P01_H01_bin.153]